MNAAPVDFLRGKRVLVAGGAGLLGTALMERLVREKIDVVGSFFTRQPPVHLAAFYQRYDFTRREECLAATRDKDAVVICAVQASGVRGVQESPTASLLPNLAIHAGLLEACSQNGVQRAVWVSSSTVYQEALYPIRESELDLNQPVYELYEGIGWVYRYLERLAACYYHKRGLPIGVIRTSNIYGPYDRFDDRKSHVLPALIKRALAREIPFTVWGDGETVRDFVYVDDLVEGVLRVLRDHCTADPVNISNGTPVRIGELARVVLDACSHNVPVVYDASQPTAVPYRVLDNAKCAALLGEFPRTPLAKGVAKTVAWYRSDLARE
jgi:GDP-L-fucose synthase